MTTTEWMKFGIDIEIHVPSKISYTTDLVNASKSFHLSNEISPYPLDGLAHILVQSFTVPDVLTLIDVTFLIQLFIWNNMEADSERSRQLLDGLA